MSDDTPLTREQLQSIVGGAGQAQRVALPAAEEILRNSTAIIGEIGAPTLDLVAKSQHVNHSGVKFAALADRLDGDVRKLEALVENYTRPSHMTDLSRMFAPPIQEIGAARQDAPVPLTLKAD